MPFDDEPQFSRWVETRMIATQRDENVADSLAILFALEIEYGSDLIEMTELTKLKEQLKIWNKAHTGIDLQATVQAANAIVQTVVRIYIEKKDVSEDAQIELGNSLHYVLQRNKISKTISFNGKKTSEWAKKYKEKKNYTWPFDNLINHLYRHKGEYEDNPDVEHIAKELFSIINDMPIIKSEIELKILDTHDIIRKLMNKPIHFSTYKTNNFDHVEDILNILKSNYNVELTPFELESIVEEQDAHRNLSIKHGVSTDVIYYIKGNFR